MKKAAKYKGRVKFIFDGDTFKVEDERKNTHTIRLYGIDAPEKKQTYGGVAHEYLKDMILNKEVEVIQIDLGAFGRELAIVYVEDKNVNKEMIMAGMAMASGNNHQFAKEFFSLQERARLRKCGLWDQETPMKPENFRAAHKEYDTSYNEATRRSLEEAREINHKKSIMSSIKDFIKKKKTDEELSEQHLLTRYKKGKNQKPSL